MVGKKLSDKNYLDCEENNRQWEKKTVEKKYGDSGKTGYIKKDIGKKQLKKRKGKIVRKNIQIVKNNLEVMGKYTQTVQKNVYSEKYMYTLVNITQ